MQSDKENGGLSLGRAPFSGATFGARSYYQHRTMMPRHQTSEGTVSRLDPPVRTRLNSSLRLR